MDQQPEQNAEKKHSTKDLGRWTLIVLLVLAALGSLTSSPLSGVLFIIAAALLSHKVLATLKTKYNFNLQNSVRIGAVVIAILAGGAMIPSTSQQNPTPAQTVDVQQPQSEAQPIVQKSDKELLEDKLREVTDKATGNFGYIGLEARKSDSERPADTQMLTASIQVKDIWNKNSFLRTSGDLSAKLFQAAFASNMNAYDVLIDYRGETTDRYGNKKDDIVTVYAIDKETLGKINWSNFDTSKLCDFLKQEEKMRGIGTGPACNVLVNIQ